MAADVGSCTANQVQEPEPDQDPGVVIVVSCWELGACRVTSCPARVPTGCEEVPSVLVMLCRGLTIEVYLYLSFVWILPPP